MVDIRTQSLLEPVDVAEYLFKRLHEIGVRSVHGIPGDYNLTTLDYIPQCGLKWVGNVNELNAGMPTACSPIVITTSRIVSLFRSAVLDS
jgi:pyruvate decarboxylase